jgi:hypothetical protein
MRRKLKMALSEEQQQDIKTGMLDINSSTFWWERLRPSFDEYMKKYDSDPELNRTLEKAINMADSATQAHKKDEVVEAMQTFMTVTGDKGYMQRHMKTASDEEKDALRDIQKKTEDLLLILKTEKPYYPPKPEDPQRVVEYMESPDDALGGFNVDWQKRNMKTLNESEPTHPELNADKVRPGAMV